MSPLDSHDYRYKNPRISKGPSGYEDRLGEFVQHTLVIQNPPDTSYFGGVSLEPLTAGTSGDLWGFKYRSSPSVWMSRA